MTMKKIFTLIAMVALAMSMQANIYVVGNVPFGDWKTNQGMLMDDNGDGTYSVTVELSGTIWFVFADALTENADEWDLFNNEYRFGPSTGANQIVELGEYIATQKQGNGNGAYQLVCGSEPSEFKFTFDLENMEFIVESIGDIVIDPDWTHVTVAGSPASVFGTEWDPSNTDNDMVMNEETGLFTLDKYGCELQEGSLEFKIVSNHSWGLEVPSTNYQYYIAEPGYYDIHFTFDSSNYEIGVVAELIDPIDPPIAEDKDLFILGEVNGNGWAPNVGVPMNTDDWRVYTAKVTTTGTNKDEGDDTEYSYFSFTSMLSESADGWADIAPYRLGAIENGYFVGADMLGMELPLSDFGHDNSFKLASGKNYTFMVNLDELTLVITEDSGVDEIAAGKMVAGVRYYNVMGQEVSEVNGVTIVVTTYTDGSTKASKVIK